MAIDNVIISPKVTAILRNGHQQYVLRMPISTAVNIIHSTAVSIIHCPHRFKNTEKGLPLYSDSETLISIEVIINPVERQNIIEQTRVTKSSYNGSGLGFLLEPKINFEYFLFSPLFFPFSSSYKFFRFYSPMNLQIHNQSSFFLLFFYRFFRLPLANGILNTKT